MIRHDLLPAITGRQGINDIERKLFALPTKLGGLGIDILPDIAKSLHTTSKTIVSPLVDSVTGRSEQHHVQTLFEQNNLAREAKIEKQKLNIQQAENIKNQLDPTTEKAMTLAQEKGASSWLTTLPIDEHGFALHKNDFRDALALRYGWRPKGMPISCACGMANNVDHALSCPRGGYVISRHNEVRDVTASLLGEAVKHVEIEPALQPLDDEIMSNRTAITSDNSRLDIKCKGFWTDNQDAFFDVRVFNPLAPSNRSRSLANLYRSQEKEKRRAYEQRVREIEMGSFTPLVMSATGGLAPTAAIFYKRLASLIALKRDQPYPVIMSLIRTRLAFSLLRSSILAIRGSRGCKQPSIDIDSARAILAEGMYNED